MPPSATAATTTASQPNVAVFQWLALQRPMCAARLRDCPGETGGVPTAGPGSSLWASGCLVRNMFLFFHVDRWLMTSLGRVGKGVVEGIEGTVRRDREAEAI